MLETWLCESGVPRLRTCFDKLTNLYRIITPPFSTLTGQVGLPVMLETWLREGRVRLPTHSPG